MRIHYAGNGTYGTPAQRLARGLSDRPFEPTTLADLARAAATVDYRTSPDQTAALVGMDDAGTLRLAVTVVPAKPRTRFHHLIAALGGAA